MDIMERSRAVFLPRSPAVPQARRRFRLRPIATWLSAAFAAAALAGTPPQPARAAPQSMSAQQLFDAAGQAAMDGHCGDALPLFEALLQRPAVTRNPRVLATARLRRAPCLVSAGRFDEATADANSAFAVVAANDPDLRVDLALAHMALGRIAFQALDRDHATTEFETARALLHPDEQYEVLSWLAQSTMFDAGDAAIGYAEQLLAFAAQAKDKPKRFLAGVRTLHARALLNHGQVDAAYAELKQALKEQGGLTMTVNLDDVETRADLALAALLNGDRSGAQAYMAYTGAGRFEKSPFATAQNMNSPPCGGPAGLQPDDMAVVEFGVDDHGQVINVVPIYASRTGPVATEFARAVLGWSWKPEDAKQIPAFFRRVTRVELRCMTTTAHPDVLEVLHADFSAFLAQRHVAPAPKGIAKVPDALLDDPDHRRAMTAEQELAAVPLMLALGESPRVPRDQQLRWLTRAREALAAAGAPVAVLIYVDARRSMQQAYYANDYAPLRATLRSLLERPEVGADARVADTLRIMIAEARYGLREPADATDLLMRVATDPALGEQDPLRVGALVRLATLQANGGDVAAARDSYRKSGLSAQECSLVDAVPIMRRSGASALDFPDEAKRWGFEGWVLVEFDIRPDGKTANQRAVAVYPPLIFRDAAVDTMKGARYTQTYRPEGGLGCGGEHVKVRFILR